MSESVRETLERAVKDAGACAGYAAACEAYDYGITAALIQLEEMERDRGSVTDGALIEKLAEKYRQEVLVSLPWDALSGEGHMRWWLNAIAWELEQSTDYELQQEVCGGTVEAGEMSADWLRAQAQEGE